MVTQISDGVRVTARILPEGVARREFGNTLFLDHVDRSVTDRDGAELVRTVRTYADLSAVESDGQPESVQEAASTYFQQVPFPKALLVGSHLSVTQPSLFFGAEPQSVAQIAALTSPSEISLNGNTTDISIDSPDTFTFQMATSDASAVAVAQGLSHGDMIHIDAVATFTFQHEADAAMTAAIASLTYGDIIQVDGDDVFVIRASETGNKVTMQVRAFTEPGSVFEIIANGVSLGEDYEASKESNAGAVASANQWFYVAPTNGGFASFDVFVLSASYANGLITASIDNNEGFTEIDSVFSMVVNDAVLGITFEEAAENAVTDVNAANEWFLDTLANADLTYTEIASRLQSAVRNIDGYSSVVVAWDASSQYFTMSADAPTMFGTGFAASDVADALGLSAGGVFDTTETETPAEALSRIADIDCNFFGVVPSDELASNYDHVDSIRDWVAARHLSFMAAFDLYGEDVLVSGETTSIGARLSAQKGDGIIGFYNGKTAGDVDYKALSYLGRFSSINYDRPNAVINGKFLDLPGTVATSGLSTSEKNELDRKRINWYEPAGRGNSADTREGKTFNTWVDVYVWLAWFKDALEVAAYNFLKQTAGNGGVPITDQGLGAMADVLEGVCERGVRNGGLAPNNVSPAMQLAIQRTTGNVEFDGFLNKGYLVHRPSAADITQATRNSRGPIPFTIYCKGSGKINNIDIDVTLEN